jgi:hypothetical protein
LFVGAFVVVSTSVKLSIPEFKVIVGFEPSVPFPEIVIPVPAVKSET